MRKNVIKLASMFGAVAAMVAGLSISTTMDIKDAESETVMYCEMVADWKASNGQRGWPDYNNTYDMHCD